MQYVGMPAAPSMAATQQHTLKPTVLTVPPLAVHVVVPFFVVGAVTPSRSKTHPSLFLS